MLHDVLTSYVIAWIQGDSGAPPQFDSSLVLTGAFFFFSSPMDSTSVASVAYQLAQNTSQARDPIARAVGQDPTVFASRCHDLVEKLIINPLRNASDSY